MYADGDLVNQTVHAHSHVRNQWRMSIKGQLLATTSQLLITSAKVMFSVHLSVCLCVGRTCKKLQTDFYEIFWRGAAWP